MKIQHIIIIATAALLFWLGLSHVRSALPPRVIVIETGPIGGTYFRNAERYAQIMKKQGFEVQLRPNPDSMTIVENVSRSDDGTVIGFTAQAVDRARAPEAVSVAVVEFQPLFLIYANAMGQLASPSGLRGKRIVLPFENSATSRAALDVMALYGVTEQNSEISFMSIEAAAEALRQGHADAGFFMLAAENALIRAMSEDSRLTLYSYSEAHSISINLSYLGRVEIPAGAFSLEARLPPEPLKLIGAPVNVVAHQSLHPAVVYALIDALQQVHGERTAVSQTGQYPSFSAAVLPLHEGAQTFQAAGKPWAHRTFSPTLASLIDEFFILALALFLATEAYRTLKYARELIELSIDSVLARMLTNLERRQKRARPMRWIDAMMINLGRRVSQRSKAHQRLKDAYARVEAMQRNA